MLVSIGRSPTHEGLVELLQACHGRIRAFLRAAERLAVAGEQVHQDVAAAVAGDVHRYFSVAFPLHLADEDESIAPRLRGSGPEVDRALATMSADHLTHATDVRRLVELCGELHAGREWNQRAAQQLSAALAAVALQLETHLQLEEGVLFPALAALDDHLQAEIIRELRARRADAMR